MSVSGYVRAVGVVLQPQSSNIQVPTAGMQAAAAGQTGHLIPDVCVYISTSTPSS